MDTIEGNRLIAEFMQSDSRPHHLDKPRPFFSMPGVQWVKLKRKQMKPETESSFYSDKIDHSSLEENSHKFPEHEECVMCGSDRVTITDDKDICHECGFVYE